MTNVNSDTTGTATATCPKGQKVVFGGLLGADHFLSGANAFPFDFYLSGKSAITVTAGENGVGMFGAPPSQVEAIAYCG
jgi:hypothetical protein